MEAEEIFARNRWSLIQALAKRPLSASDVAREIGQTTANASTQLKLLEAWGFVKKAKSAAERERKKAGKPKIPYTLAQEHVMIAVARPGLAEKRVLRIGEMDPFQELMLNTAFIATEDSYAILQYCCKASILKKAETVAFLKSEGNDVELFIITDKPEHLQEIRSKHSQFQSEELKGKTKKVISWSHNRKEIEEGLERKEEYFINLVERSRILIDQRSYLAETKRRLTVK